MASLGNSREVVSPFFGLCLSDVHRRDVFQVFDAPERRVDDGLRHHISLSSIHHAPSHRKGYLSLEHGSLAPDVRPGPL